MRRRPPLPGLRSLRASGDRWLFGYADIVTLLFACFASLYATHADRTMAAPIAVVPPPVAEPVAPPTPAALGPPGLEAQLSGLLQHDDGEQPAVELSFSHRGLVVSLPEAGSFPPGQAELTPAARRTIGTIALAVRSIPNFIRVEGHTDDVPIRTAIFASNWELSTARATHVVQFLIEDAAFEPTRLSAAGYGEYRPRVPNRSAIARARNRRVDIVILDPAVASREEPEGR